MIVKNNKLKLKQKNLISKKINISNYFFYDFEEGWNVIKDLKTNKYGWINENFTKIIEPIFDKSYNFQNGFAVFEKDEKQGWIDTSGKILIDNCDYCYPFKNNSGIFRKDGKYGLINTGKIIGEGFDTCSYFKNEFALFIKDNKEGWIDKNGKIYTKNPY